MPAIMTVADFYSMISGMTLYNVVIREIGVGDAVTGSVTESATTQTVRGTPVFGIKRKFNQENTAYMGDGKFYFPTVKADGSTALDFEPREGMEVLNGGKIYHIHAVKEYSSGDENIGIIGYKIFVKA